jgi:hypothetical protein
MTSLQLLEYDPAGRLGEELKSGNPLTLRLEHQSAEVRGKRSGEAERGTDGPFTVFLLPGPRTNR